MFQIEDAACNQCPLDDQSASKQIEARRAVAVALQERHQKGETHEYHDVYVLKVYYRMLRIIGVKMYTLQTKNYFRNLLNFPLKYG